MSLELEFEAIVTKLATTVSEEMLQKLNEMKVKIAELERKFKLYDEMIEMDASQRY